MNTKTYSVNIKKKVASLGITIIEQLMPDPMASVLLLEKTPVLYVNRRLTGVQKRKAIADAMAVCLQEKEPTNCIVAHEVENDISAIARRLLLPEKDFCHENERLRSFGPLRYSILAALFKVSLTDVMERVAELGLTED